MDLPSNQKALFKATELRNPLFDQPRIVDQLPEEPAIVETALLTTRRGLLKNRVSSEHPEMAVVGTGHFYWQAHS